MKRMEEEKKSQGPDKSVKELDLVWLIKYLYDRRKLILKAVGACVVLSIIIFCCRKKTFTCKAGILPLSAKTSSLGGLGSLASLAGVDANKLMGGNQTDRITPDLFSNIAQSTPALLEIMNKPMTWTDPDTVESLYSHVVRDSVPTTFWGKVAKYTIKLPGTIMASLAKAPTVVPVVDSAGYDRPMVLDKSMEACIKDLSSRINVEMDEDVNIVWITCQAENAEQSAELTLAVIDYIQKMSADFITQNARKNLKFTEEQFDLAMEDYNDKRSKWFRYKDSHRYAVEERESLESSSLSESYNLALSLVTNLQEQVAACKLEVANKTPAFTVVEPVVTPTKKTSPRLSYHLVGGIIAGFVFAVGALLVILGFKQVFKPAEFAKIYDQYKEEEEA